MSLSVVLQVYTSKKNISLLEAIDFRDPEKNTAWEL